MSRSLTSKPESDDRGLAVAQSVCWEDLIDDYWTAGEVVILPAYLRSRCYLSVDE